MTIGFVAAVVNGCCLPAFALIFGEMVDSFKPTTTPDDVVK